MLVRYYVYFWCKICKREVRVEFTLVKDYFDQHLFQLISCFAWQILSICGIRKLAWETNIFYQTQYLRDGPWDNREIAVHNKFLTCPLDLRKRKSIQKYLGIHSFNLLWATFERVRKTQHRVLGRVLKNLITNFSIFRIKWVQKDSGRQ
jgi:hypothetical protein